MFPHPFLLPTSVGESVIMIMMKQLYACVAVPVLGAWYVCVCAYFGMRDCGHVGLGGTMAW